MQKKKQVVPAKYIGGKNSYYARKLVRRRKESLRLKLPANTPWPVIWAHQEEERAEVVRD